MRSEGSTNENAPRFREAHLSTAKFGLNFAFCQALNLRLKWCSASASMAPNTELRNAYW